MFKIDSETNNISLTRGNSFSISVKPYIESTEEVYIPESTDTIVFSVKGSTGKTYIQKVIKGTQCQTDGTIYLSLSPEDTVDMVPFEYNYDMLLIKKGGRAYTFLGSAKFILLEAVGTINDIQ